MIDRTRYEIRVKGTLDGRWRAWFESYAITFVPSGETVLSGQISDPRLLIGTLVTLHELGHPLVSIIPAPQEHTQVHATRPGLLPQARTNSPRGG